MPRKAVNRSNLTILDAMTDPAIFGKAFAGPSWDAWRVCLRVAFGLPMTDAQLAILRQHTGRQTAPTARARELWWVIGRRGGKDRIAALVIVFLACFFDWHPLLAPGERGTIMGIAVDRRQARVLLGYVVALLESVPMLARMVVERTKEGITLSNDITIEIHTASFRSVRGYTILAAVCDEIAFWPTEDAAEPDVEVLNAIRPGMATVPGALLLCISSPYARRGALWEAYKSHYGRDGDPILIWQADTRSMNPTIDEWIIQEAYEADESAASAEYGAQFRRDIEGFVTREAVDACVIPGRLELPPAPGLDYVAFCDPAGGSGGDSMTVAIAHNQDGRGILDLVRECRPPFSPEQAVEEFAAALKEYRIAQAVGDRYAGEWPRERFRVRGIEYHVAEKIKSDIYRDLLPLLNSARVELLDQPRLIAQLCGLERKTARGGRDTIDHGPQNHDDVVNVAAGVLVMAMSRGSYEIRIWGGGLPDDPARAEALEQERQRIAADDMTRAVQRRGSWFPGDPI